MRRRAVSTGFAALVLVLAAGGCQREERQTRLDPPIAAALDGVALMPDRISGAPPAVYVALGKPYERNAFNLAEGKRLYGWFGCAACHGEGEGGKGPAFLDGWWAYGPSMVSIVSSIRDGRPHGMPPFRDKMTTEQIWQLAGYVQTIGAYSAKTAAPGRSDAKQRRPAENRAPAALLFDPGPTPLHPDQGPEP
ncbi:c-type cytochrome [Rhodoplanes roseus]|uniref:Cytochrome C oxidase subunit III n=1 Tax=Rhodoplanes roseus TaxID=29409 RepID=A0A327KNR3_9BRAD|nr:c-type cytochrome [Rhodoplanes roseus]RAI38962.1 cytochrome C oxidase subunit III [Rhodoplanes roseus]